MVFPRIALGTIAATFVILTALIAMAGMPAAGLAQTAAPPPLPQNSLCYLVGDGQNPATGVLLHTDNFGNDFVGVGRLALLCEAANKFSQSPSGGPPPNVSPPTADQSTVAACYVVNQSSGNRRAQPYRLTTANFQADDVTVGQGILLCEQATKVPLTVPVGSTQPPQPPAGIAPPSNPYVAECFVARGGKAINKPFTLDTLNFGPDQLTVVQGTLLCETAAKTRITAATVPGPTTGVANRQVEECFVSQGGDDPARWVALDTKNFGVTTVQVHRAVLMCERAEKTPRFIFPNPLGNPAAVLAPILHPNGDDSGGDSQGDD